MTQARKPTYFPPTWDDLQFINQVSDYAIDKKFRRDTTRSLGKNATQKRYLYNHFKSELRSLLTTPENSNINQVGEVLWFMNNYDRMILLKRRPALIKNCEELDVILRNYTQPGDALLLACSQINLLFDAEDNIREANIQLIVRAMPEHHRDSFSAFAESAMAKALRKYRITHPVEPSSAPTIAFSAGTLLAAMGALGYLMNSNRLITVSAFLGAAGCLSAGLLGLQKDNKKWFSMWAKNRNINEIGANTPARPSCP